MGHVNPTIKRVRPVEQAGRRRTAGFWLAVLLGIAFQALCFLRIGLDAKVLLPQERVLRSVFDTPLWESTLAKHAVFFALAHLFLAGTFGITCWLLARMSLRAWPDTQLTRAKWIAAWIVLGAVWLFVANAALFRWSSLGEFYHEAVSVEWLGISAFDVVSIASGLCVLTTLIRATWKTVAYAPPYSMAIMRRMRMRVLAPLCVIATALVGVAVASMSRNHPPLQADRPNVFLIGIDSLRPDIALDERGWALTPSITAFLRESTTFGDAITPLARTFPSWVSILTGREPQSTGAYINLLSPTAIHMGETLPQTLRRSGYETQYAIDEVRFSNIDATYGFDRTVTPRIGASDFALNSLNDTPLSNLLLNTRLGAWLFPDSYGNRAAAVNYDPDTFITRLRRELEFDGPTFTAVHMTLPHWPFYWATAPARPDDTVNQSGALYKMAVRRVDRQFTDLMNMLQARGALEKAIVIVLSDHGEGIAAPDDMPFAYSENEKIKTAVGHGTSVLAPAQYRVVLGVRLFGFNDTKFVPPRRIDVPVSLIDLAPTVVDMLGLKAADAYDGMSLKPVLQAQADSETAFAGRIRYTQTEFNPAKFKPGTDISASALADIASYYHVDPVSNRIFFRESLVPKILRERQYAALQGQQMIVALPNADRSAFNMYAAQRTGGLLRSADASDAAPQTVALRSALETHFQVIAQRGR